MILKFIKAGFIIIFLYGCGYTPIFSNSNNADLNINIIKLEGDKEINNLLSQKLSRYQKVNSEKNYNIEAVSKYKKNSLTKNTEGNTTNYRLSLQINFIATLNNIPQTITLSEKFDMKKGNTVFEEESYEKFIKENMTNLIIQKLLQQL
tara:strand:+ start:585 stop:1031 length:447 start_codon:yes stop_codon:yes gene_type:complete